MQSTLIRRSQKGFTLAELLISLAILGVIATFTIPKILSSSSSGQNTAIAKEIASMVSGAFTTYTLNTSLTSGTTPGALTQYMNYVATDATTTYTGSGGTALQPCTATLLCLKLHNGGVLQYDTAQTFAGTASTNGVVINMDPDGNGTQGRASFSLYANGRLTTGGVSVPTAGGSITLTNQTTDPAYIANWN
jgi:prepilin-type N-terminal cleavage/methylation domain-containing protein